VPAPVAVVLTLARFDQQTANVVRTVAACGAPVVAVPYLAADEAAVRACCEPLGIAVVPAPPHAAFGGAANAGAAAASGDALAFVDGAEPMGPGWLPTLLAALAAAGGGVAGPHLTTDGGAGEECGFLASAAPLSARGFSLQGYSGVHVRIDVDAVSRDCMLTARATFDELGGFAETFGSRLEGLDYCLRVRESGRRVIFEPAAAFTRHGAPVPHGEQRPEGERAFFERWRERVEPHENLWPELTKSLLRRTFHSVGILVERVPIPPITVLVHGNVPASPDFARRLFASRLQPTDVVWAAGGVAPPGTRPAVGDAAAAARGMTERRGSDLVAFVRTDTALASDWLNELVNVLERAPDTVAATIAEPWTSSEMPATADARCTLVAPRLIPQHLRIAAGAPMDAALAAWLGNAVDAGRDIARVRRTATVVAPDRSCRFP
jgi:GT2 family glycosyltransferase